MQLLLPASTVSLRVGCLLLYRLYHIIFYKIKRFVLIQSTINHYKFYDIALYLIAAITQNLRLAYMHSTVSKPQRLSISVSCGTEHSLSNFLRSCHSAISLADSPLLFYMLYPEVVEACAHRFAIRSKLIIVYEYAALRQFIVNI